MSGPVLAFDTTRTRGAKITRKSDIAADVVPAKAAAHELFERRGVQQTAESIRAHEVIDLAAPAGAEQKPR